jgi:CRISPR-associated protein Csy2
MNEPTALLLLPRLQVQNANAISGPLSWGFPSPTAFTGFAHALQRRFAEAFDKGFGGVGIVCHRFEPQVSQPAGKRTQVFRLTRNPVGKDGATTALVEEGRAHLEVSLLIAVHDYLPPDEGQYLAEDLMAVAQGMRLAGGSILPQRAGKRYATQWLPLPEDRLGQDQVFAKLRRRLLPGFALVQREDRLQERLDELRAGAPASTALDALLDLSRLNIEPAASATETEEETANSANEKKAHPWHIRGKPGWLVPLPIGYGALSPLYAPEQVANGRDGETPLRFVESLYSLGEWLSPHRLQSLEQLLWHAEADPEHGIYRCINRYSSNSTPAPGGIA